MLLKCSLSIVKSDNISYALRQAECEIILNQLNKLRNYHMMRIFTIVLLKLIIISTLFASPASDSLGSDILLHTFIESDNVPLNSEVVYHIELRWHGDLNKFRIKEVQEPVLTNLTTRGSGSSNKVNTMSDGTLQSIKRITFYLIPVEMGMSYIDGITIKYTDAVSGVEESLISSRIGVKIIEPVAEPGSSPYLSVILWSLTIILIVSGFMYFYTKYQKRKAEEKKRADAEKLETTEQKYLRLLRETIQFETDNIKESLSDLSHLLTGYLTEKYNLPAGGIATQNLLEILKEKQLSPETFARIEEFYPRADLVKFAGEKVDISEFHRLYDTVELVIENQAKGSSYES